MFDELDDSNPLPFDGPFRESVRSRVRTRSRRNLAVTGMVGALILGIGGLYLNAANDLRNIKRIEVAGTGQIESGGPSTILLIGTDGADSIAAQPEGGRRSGDRADAMVLVRVDPNADSIRLLSLPRDLNVAPEGSPVTKLNDRLATGGVDAVVSAIEALGFEVNHVVIVDFDGFKALVDSVGGIDLKISASLRDRQSGLVVGDTGCTRLDGTQDLALARARHLEVHTLNGWVRDDSGDLGRTERQRTMLIAATEQLRRQTPDPFTVNQLASWALDHVTVDDELSIGRLIDLIKVAAHVDPSGIESSGLLTTTEDASSGPAYLRTADTLAQTVESFERDAVDQSTTHDTPVQPGLTPGPVVEPCAG